MGQHAQTELWQVTYTCIAPGPSKLIRATKIQPALFAILSRCSAGAGRALSCHIQEEFTKGLRSHFPLPSWYEHRAAPSTFPSHQLLEHAMQICAKESQQRTWETINICEKSPHKSTGRGIYGAFFGDFSGCSLLSHCACLHKYSSDSKVFSAISYRLCKQEQHQAWDVQTPSCKDEGLAPHLVKK